MSQPTNGDSSVISLPPLPPDALEKVKQIARERGDSVGETMRSLVLAGLAIYMNAKKY